MSITIFRSSPLKLTRPGSIVDVVVHHYIYHRYILKLHGRMSVNHQSLDWRLDLLKHITVSLKYQNCHLPHRNDISCPRPNLLARENHSSGPSIILR